MTITGIIAEYHPFHNGHAYQIREARRLTGADYVAVIMSGDFVQRGAPACMDKYTRAKAALLGGADLVLELPTAGACASAETFAMTGVSILDHLNCVDYLCFGCESADQESLSGADLLARLLATEPPLYQELLRSYLKKGLSYPKARSLAASEYVSAASGIDPELLSNLLKNPNDLLAIEYRKALLRLSSTIKVCPVKRIGSGYHVTDTDTPFADSVTANQAGTFIYDRNTYDPSCCFGEAGTASSCYLEEHAASTGKQAAPGDFEPLPSAYASAEEIRKTLQEASAAGSAPDLSGLDLPEAAISLYQEYLSEWPLLWEDDFSLLLHAALLQHYADKFDDDNDTDLNRRIRKNMESFVSWSSFIHEIKPKNRTYTAISRSLASILLPITSEDQSALEACDHAPYARILGFRSDAGPVVSEISRRSSIPVITSLPDAISEKEGSEPYLSQEQQCLLSLDMRAAALYGAVLTNKGGKPFPPELRRKMLRLND